MNEREMERSLRPALRADVSIRQDAGWGADRYIVRRGDSFYSISGAELWVMQRLDGSRTISELVADRRSERQDTLADRQVQRFVDRLAVLGLLEGSEGGADAEGQAALLSWWRLSPAATAAVCARLSWIANRFVVWIVLILTLVAALGIGVRWDAVGIRLAAGIDLGTIAMMVFAGLLTAPLHELAHGAALTRLGEQPGRSGIGFYRHVFPVTHIDVGRAWALPGARQRLRVWAAGPLIDLAFLAIGTHVWIWTAGAASGWGFALTAAAALKLASNMNPLLGGDGADMLAELCGAPNVVSKMWAALRNRTRSRGAGYKCQVSGRAERMALVISLLYQPVFLLVVGLFVQGVGRAVREGRFMA